MKYHKGNTAYREKLPKNGNFKHRYEFPALHKCPISKEVRPYTANYYPEFEVGDLVYWTPTFRALPGVIIDREKAHNRRLGASMWLYTVKLDEAPLTGGQTVETFSLTHSGNPQDCSNGCNHLLTERTKRTRTKKTRY